MKLVNKRTRIIIALYFLIIAFMFTYLPWKMNNKHKVDVPIGYSFLWSPPEVSRAITIDYKMVFLSIIAITGVFVSAGLLFGYNPPQRDEEKKYKTSNKQISISEIADLQQRMEKLSTQIKYIYRFCNLLLPSDPILERLKDGLTSTQIQHAETIIMLINLNDFTPNEKISMAHYNRGEFYLARSEYEKAIEFYSESIKENLGNLDAYFKRGIAYDVINQKNIAKIDFLVVASLSFDYMSLIPKKYFDS